MNRTSSESIGSGSHHISAVRMRRCHQRSRPSVMSAKASSLILERFVGIALERDDAAAPIAAVGGHEDSALRVVDAVAQRLGREAAEHHRVDGTDARAGEHRDGRLRDEREIDGDAISLLHPERPEDVGELVDLDVQIPVGEGAPVAGLSLEHQRGLVAPGRAHVAVEAVHRNVEPSAGEPFGVRRLPVEDRRVSGAPLELVGLVGPVRLGVGGGVRVDLRRGDIGLGAKRRGRVELPVLGEEDVEIVGHLRRRWVGCRMPNPATRLRRKQPARWRDRSY